MKFRVWRTDGAAVTPCELEAHNAWQAAREFAQREWVDGEEAMGFKMEDSTGRQFQAEVEIEMEPTFDVGVREIFERKEER